MSDSTTDALAHDAFGVTTSPIWGDEAEAVSLAMNWAAAQSPLFSDPTTATRSAHDLDEQLGQTITPEGIGATRAIRGFADVLVQATRATNHPMNLSYIPASPTRAAIAFDAVVSAANVFTGVWDFGAGLIHAENQVIRWLVELLGWPETAGGTFVSGGTMGNLSALATARDSARRGDKGKTVQHGAIACASTAHSSITTTASLLDVDVVPVPVDERGHLTGAALSAALEAHPEIFAVVCTAGTTNGGLVDDIDSISEVAERENLWLHVDAAYGGAALAAPSVRPRFAGIERADSFIVDPHKWLFAPYDCCALIYRDPRSASRTHSQQAAYLDSLERNTSNPADLAVQLSRRARGLPLWYSLATHGTQKYTDAIETCLSVTRDVADAIERSEHLELVAYPELSIILFRRLGWSASDYHDWSARLARDGIVLCVPTLCLGETVLRLAFVNPHTSADEVISVLEDTLS